VNPVWLWPDVGVPAAAAALSTGGDRPDVQAVAQPPDDAGARLRAAAPVVVPVDGGLLSVAAAGRRRARLTVPSGATVSAPTNEVAAAITAHEAAGTSPSSWWVVRSSPGTSFGQQCRRAGIPRQLALFVAAHAAHYGLFLWSWAVLGRAAFAGDVDGGALLRWGLLLAATVPARLAATRLQTQVAIGAGWLLRRRLLHGTLKLRPDETRREGAGQLLGRSMEAEAVEDLAIGGGLLGVLAAVEVTMAMAVLLAGPGPLLAGVLVGWVALTVAAARSYIHQRRRWAASRLTLAHDLIEKMVGHRTRLVQQPPEHWHDGDEERLSTYARLGRDMDRRLTALLAAAPRGWMVVAVIGLGVEMSGGASPSEVAVGAGGILLALSALTRLVNGLAQIADAAVAWSQVAPLYDAAARQPAPLDAGPPAGAGAPLVEADGVVYHYAGRERPALAACSVRIDRGDRLLLEGGSGSGKSTLAAVLSGLREPTDGRLRLEGVDQVSVGVPAWRRRIVASPQFHENHVVLGPMAFNLLLGRGWPPRPQDLQEAYEVCVALGLGPLLERMPAGMQQMVGDTGWQLSHGERSLVFLARALLQGADVVLLDETFGSLDPLTMQRALAVTLERTETLVVIRQ
jgi:ATP-binding cassette subfamily B protein